jgi:hypothetical protein
MHHEAPNAVFVVNEIKVTNARLSTKKPEALFFLTIRLQ